MKYLIWYISCIYLFTNASAFAQDVFITISGKITDAQSHAPIPYANIQIKSKGIGTASNLDGEFVFKIPATQAYDTLLVSCIGYKTSFLPVRSAGLKVAIRLTPSVLQLGEVTVTAESGLDFLKKVVARIPENYDTSKTQLTAFYRENIWLGDFELSFTEAVLDIQKVFKVEKKKPNDEIRIIKGRKKQIDYGNDGQFYYWMSAVSNGVRGSLADDLVKYHNAKFSPLSPRNFKYYRYEFGGIIREGNRNLLVLDVIPKQNARKGILILKLFIEEESLAIVKYDYHLSEAGVRYVSRQDNGLAYLIMSKVVKATRDYDKFEGTHTYKKLDNKWYLSAVKRHWEILVSSKKRNMVDRLWTADMDLIVTDINTNQAKPVAAENIGDNKSSVASLIGNNYDPEFWENFNILKPVIGDSTERDTMVELKPDHPEAIQKKFSNREQGFTRADTLRGKLTPLRTCYDVTFYHLDVAIDMDQRSLKGSNLIRFDAMTPFKKIQVDLYENMTIDKILYKGQPLGYTREFNAVFIEFPIEILPGAQHELKIYYSGTPKSPDWDIPMNGGVLWDKDSLGNPWAQMVCQGSGASLWWPNKDHQSDEPDSMKIWITIPSEYTEISNGRLIRKTQIAENQTRYEWGVSYPINNYNVTFNIGKYVHYQDEYISDDTLTIDYYVMPYNLDRSKKMFTQVKPMLKCFERNFGKYPFKRDGFTLVESIYPMEHQSGVCIGKINAENAGDTNPLLWHESAHEWWGNAITTKDIADMWVHEAFATYAEYQVIEERFGRDLAYQAIQEQVEAVQNTQPIIGAYDVNHIFYDIGDMYSKGSLMLHTFRNVLNNDTLWVNLLRDIQREFRYKTISSNQLVTFISERTQTDFTYFFDQYLKFTRLPLLEIELEENETNLRVKYRWVADVADFRMPVKVTTARNHFEFIYPTTDWQSVTLRNLDAHEFEVNEEEFFIHVEIN